jgi:hypothetical protein
VQTVDEFLKRESKGDQPPSGDQLSL